MTPLDLLWLPILLSAVFVFIVSGIVNAGPLWHKNDFPRHKDQEGILNALRPFNIAPGEYLLPRAADRKAMESPEYKDALDKGPVMIMTVWKYSSSSLGTAFVSWFIHCIVIGIFAAYIAGRALPSGADYLSVFRFIGTTAFLAYGAALWQFTIWFNKPWRTTLKMSFDGLIYALITAGTFGWLWPG